MEFSVNLSGSEMSKVKSQVDALNTSLNGGRGIKSDLGRDDFLKILLTQLTHQDPTAPMQDRDFIAQMAQFSSLEQMTNMSKQFTDLAGVLSQGQAVSVLGKNVEILEGETMIQGKVSKITGGSSPQVEVNGKYYDYNQVQSVEE